MAKCIKMIKSSGHTGGKEANSDFKDHHWRQIDWFVIRGLKRNAARNQVISECDTKVFKWAITGTFLNYFRSSTSNRIILQQINVKTDPSIVWCCDSNSQPLDYCQSPPWTTRPKNLPQDLVVFSNHFKCFQ